MYGKGDKYRDVDKEKYDEQYEKIFGKKKLNNAESNTKCKHGKTTRKKNKRD